MLNNNKKAQGFGGLLRVIVIGIFFWATWPFIASAFDIAANSQTGLTKWLINGIPFVVAYMALHFAYTLGEGTEVIE